MKNEDEYYTDKYLSPEIQEESERWMKALREQYAKDPGSIYRRPDAMWCLYLLSLKDPSPGAKIRLLKIKDGTAEYDKQVKKAQSRLYSSNKGTPK